MKKIIEKIVFFVMVVVAQAETLGSIKRLKCRYDKPNSITGLIPYWENFLAFAHTDPLFATYDTMLDACDLSVKDLDIAEKAALDSIGTGKATARNIQYNKTESQMDLPLGVVQQAADDMTPAAAIELFQRFKLKVDERGAHGPVEEDVIPGDEHGSILVTNKKIDSTTTYLRMISDDNKTWYVGDWGKKVRGLITEMNDHPLTSGKLYYVKTRVNGKDGKKPFGNTFEVYCP